MDRLNEMAFSRQDAIDRCVGLGKKFVEHFDKIYNNRNSIDIEHWTTEMESWWNKVKDIKMASNNRTIRDVDLLNWFFDGGQLASDFMTSNDDGKEAEVFDKFARKLLNRDTTVTELIDEMLLKENNESMKLREWNESPYRFIKSKEVRDNDGFITDYTWYYDERDGVHFFMFGDRDLYTPNRDYADWECDTYEEAEEWFYDYGTEEYIDDSRFYEGANKMNFKFNKKFLKEEVEEAEVQVIKYYFPITVELEEREYDDAYEIPSSQAREYIDEIRKALKKEHTYVTPEMLGEFTRIPKVQSVEFDVGTVRGNLYGIAKVVVLGELTKDEEEELIDWIEGQNSDGFGEGFEQEPIEVDDGAIYVHFWEPSRNYFIRRI